MLIRRLTCKIALKHFKYNFHHRVKNDAPEIMQRISTKWQGLFVLSYIHKCTLNE